MRKKDNFQRKNEKEKRVEGVKVETNPNSPIFQSPFLVTYIDLLLMDP